MVKGSVSSGRRAGTGDASYSNSRKGGAASQPVRRARDKTRRQGPRLLEDPANDERLLAAQLKRLGLYAANTLGDGSCLFRALSDQMYGNPNYHLRIRQEVCEFLLEHQSEFIAFIDDSSHSSPEAAYAAHIAEMRLAGTYGTQVEIVAFARMFRRRVKVIQAELVYVIGFEDESPTAKAKRAMRSDAKGKGKQEGEDLPSLYIVYHNWEHYSSARNLEGPHTGLPAILEQKMAISSADTAESMQDQPNANQEESIILSSLRYPHRHNVTEIRKLIHDHQGHWEQALEHLLENEMDETESEDFNNPSPQPPLPDQSLPPPSPMHLATNSALPQHLLHDNRHPASGLSVLHRSSSPSASSSTATSTTHLSASTTATRLSDYVNNESDSPGKFDKAESASTSPSCASSATRVRSRAVSTDQEIQAAESPRQRFRITREVEERDDSSSVAGEDLATIDSSSVVSVSSASNEAESDAASADVPNIRLSEHLQPDQRPASVPLLPPRKRGRPPKKRDGLAIPRPPTRKQRKQFAKAAGSPIGGRTRSKLPTQPKEENGLQREFKELFV